MFWFIFLIFFLIFLYFIPVSRRFEEKINFDDLPRDLKNELLLLLFKKKDYSSFLNLGLTSSSFLKEFSTIRNSVNKQDLFMDLFVKRGVLLLNTKKFINCFFDIHVPYQAAFVTFYQMKRRMETNEIVPFDIGHIKNHFLEMLNNFAESSSRKDEKTLKMIIEAYLLKPDSCLFDESIVPNQLNHLKEVKSIFLLEKKLKKLDLSIKNQVFLVFNLHIFLLTNKIDIYKRYFVEYECHIIYFSFFDYLFIHNQFSPFSNLECKSVGIDLEQEQEEKFLTDHTLKKFLLEKYPNLSLK